MCRKNQPVFRTVLLIVIILFLLCLLAARYMTASRSQEQNVSGHPAENALSNPDEPPGLNDVINSVKAVKNDLKSVLNDIKKNRLDSAKSRTESIINNIHTIRASVNRIVSMFNGSVPFLQKQIDTVQELLNAAEAGAANILLPAIDLLQTYPLSDLRVGDGMNVVFVGKYLDFAESVMPDIDRLLACANSIDLSMIDSDGKIADYLVLANELMDLYRENPGIFSLLKSMVGANEDRLYLLAVQNSAEIRASGGFPGSIGTVRIQDGVLSLGDFKSVTYMLSARTPKDIQITSEEKALFGHLSGIQTPRDADLCPDFERVGHIWASAYEEMHGEPVAGVITMTPHIVQRLLAAMNKEIELFDGLILNANNATQILQHDIYFKYYSNDYVSDRDLICDQLFADAAQKTMKKLMSNISLPHLLAYMGVAQESFQDRTLMLWMRNEFEQNLIKKMGWSGGLNADPENPEAGVYFNCIAASKMGWFLLTDISIGERTGNEDGSYTYPVTVTFSNNITDEEIQSASHYIISSHQGAIRGAAYFFAPAGGTIGNFATSNGSAIKLHTYQHLELGFMDSFSVKPNSPVTVTYTVTTAPGVETPLAISKTPTAQQNS